MADGRRPLTGAGRPREEGRVLATFNGTRIRIRIVSSSRGRRQRRRDLGRSEIAAQRRVQREPGGGRERAHSGQRVRRCRRIHARAIDEVARQRAPKGADEQWEERVGRHGHASG